MFQNGVINFGTPPGLRSQFVFARIPAIGVLLASRLSAHQQAEQYVVPVHVLVIQPDVLTWLLSYPLVLQATYTISCKTFPFSVYRPLGLVCTQRDCKIHTEEVSRNPHTGDVHYRVNVQVGLVRLEYAGSLMVCAGPKDLFRKTPLIHIERDVHCAAGNPPLLVPHLEGLLHCNCRVFCVIHTIIHQ